MPCYTFTCKEHGTYDLFQSINKRYKGKCSKCRRVFNSFSMVGVFPAKIGKTRQELFDNLAKEGQANKEWRQYDSYYHRAKGMLDKEGNLR